MAPAIPPGVVGQEAKSPCACSTCRGFRNLAEWTGLEPATPGVTGRYSNQLNYHSKWSATASWSLQVLPAFFLAGLVTPRGFEPL